MRITEAGSWGARLLLLPLLLAQQPPTPPIRTSNPQTASRQRRRPLPSKPSNKPQLDRIHDIEKGKAGA